MAARYGIKIAPINVLPKSLITFVLIDPDVIAASEESLPIQIVGHERLYLVEQLLRNRRVIDLKPTIAPMRVFSTLCLLRELKCTALSPLYPPITLVRIEEVVD